MTDDTKDGRPVPVSDNDGRPVPVSDKDGPIPVDGRADKFLAYRDRLCRDHGPRPSLSLTKAVPRPWAATIPVSDKGCAATMGVFLRPGPRRARTAPALRSRMSVRV